MSTPKSRRRTSPICSAYLPWTMIEKNFLPLRLSSVPFLAATDAAAENLVRRAAATCVVDHRVLRGDNAAALVEAQ